MTAPVPLREVHDALEYGGKAAQLGAALRAGLCVPQGFALDHGFVAAVAADDAASGAALDAARATVPDTTVATAFSAMDCEQIASV